MGEMNLLAGKGLKRWVLPVELGLDTLKDLLVQLKAIHKTIGP